MSLSILFSLKRVAGGFFVSSINRTSPFHLLCQFPKVAIINSMCTLDSSCVYRYVLYIHVCVCKKKRGSFVLKYHNSCAFLHSVASEF